ncbi:glycosyltransferase family 25 protein [Pelagibacterium luteolum]|uniref:Glycosyltransferase involved in LPS biosynthesis, GR25 family n=1 Tax=Pelagibacterium luteolum TaxID=440168 RepID=A0A1G7XX89_9HYPH|nr:glycosyltransferase family 25 protein [Pelagibacterium luteolum]SDG88656.1 Glycosyltransferase involved in LPS biosynthesis, GR25 family [Pelagibacterium luteolum]
MTVTLSYINLDTRADRREFFEEQTRRLGLDFKRQSAITPADLTPDEIARFCAAGQGIRPVELACIKSHLAMIEDFVSTGKALGAFFEDDALLSDTLPQFLEDYEDSGGFGYDLIRLDHARRVRLFPASQTTSTQIAIHEFRSTLTGAAGYLLTRDAALKLAAYNGWGDRVFDHALYDPFSRPGNLLTRANVNPALVVQFASRGESRENSGIGLSDIDPPPVRKIVSSHKPRHRIANTRTSISAFARGIRNALDHLILLPKGLKSTRVYFKGDSPYCQIDQKQPGGPVVEGKEGHIDKPSG